MPTKPNKAGQQQNYVPQGNGDASGEYANNESGSNIHWTNFKKSDEQGTEKVEQKFTTFKKVDKTETKVETKPTGDIQTVRKNTKHRLIGKCTNPSRENDITFGEVVEDSNDESVKILDEYLNSNSKLKIKFGNAGRNAAGVAYGYGDIITNHDVHTIRHELGHTFDNWYGKDLPKSEDHFAFESQDYASVRFVDKETGKTMNEMLHEELGVSMYQTTLKGWKLSYKKLGVDKREVKIASAQRINEIYNKYADRIFDEETGIKNSRERYKELRTKYNDLNWNIDKDLVDTPEYKNYQQLKSLVYKAENDYRDQMIKGGAYSISYDNSTEVRQARANANVARQKYEKLKKDTFKKKFGEKELAEYNILSQKQFGIYKKLNGVAGIVGDTMDYLGAGSTFYTTNGHGNNYFKQRRESGYALEIFANMFDCYMSKDTWKKEAVKEMFPKTTKIFEQIYYKKGR